MGTMGDQKYWLVWRFDGRQPTFRHETLESARLEAERLAVENPGLRFDVLEALSACRKSSVDWTHLRERDAELPF